jgi:hypothetical protein
LTGWTHDALRAQPAWVVQGLMHRVFAHQAWNPDLADMARRTVNRSSHASTSDWAAARRAQCAASKALAEVTAALWPEGD